VYGSVGAQLAHRSVEVGDQVEECSLCCWLGEERERTVLERDSHMLVAGMAIAWERAGCSSLRQRSSLVGKKPLSRMLVVEGVLPEEHSFHTAPDCKTVVEDIDCNCYMVVGCCRSQVVDFES
jgi:hypothetical protein